MTCCSHSISCGFSAAQYPITDLRPPGVLVATRDPVTRARLAVQLARQGFDVWAARSVSTTLDALVRHAGQVDVVLIDATMPGLANRDFLEQLKTDWCEVACVLLHEDELPIPRIVSAVATEVVSKSIAPADLAARLWETVVSGGWVNT